MAGCQGELTMAELVKKYDVHANRVTYWERQMLDGGVDVFGKGVQKLEAADKTIEQLHAKIGKLAMENDFLKRGRVRIHGCKGKKRSS